MTPSVQMIDLMTPTRALHNQLRDCIAQISLLENIEEIKEWSTIKYEMILLDSNLLTKIKTYEKWARNWY